MLHHIVLIPCFLLILTSHSSATTNEVRLVDVVDQLISLSSSSSSSHYPSPYSSKDSSKELFLVAVDDVDIDDVITVHLLLNRHGFRATRRLHQFSNVFIAEKIERRKRNLPLLHISSSSQIRWSEKVLPLIRRKRRTIIDTTKTSGLFSMNVPRVHTRGITGKGVTVAVLDDGVDYFHSALKHAYSRPLSYDFSTGRPDALPEVGQTHGTNCAGLISMASNSSCGVGVAYEASLANLKVFGEVETMNDLLEGEALAFHNDKIDVYSVSWGPEDDGKSVEGPHRLASMALERGAMVGRKGRGVLFVWASGNGGRASDDCSLDGYASNKNTITFGVSDVDGNSVWYSESCPAIMATVIDVGGDGIMTSTVGGGCAHFTGSSAAAPLTAAMLALVLQANPKLSQRDVQHLIVHTSDRRILYDSNNSDTTVNAAGLPFSRSFGFGLLDVERMVVAAPRWVSVTKEKTCSHLSTNNASTLSSGDDQLVVEVPFDSCHDTSSQVDYVERIQLVVSVQLKRRGLLSLYLTSPMGTTVQLLKPRPLDDSSEGLMKWPFVVSHFWGENGKGTWKLTVKQEKSNTSSDVIVSDVNLIVHGTSEDPLKDNQFIRR